MELIDRLIEEHEQYISQFQKVVDRNKLPKEVEIYKNLITESELILSALKEKKIRDKADEEYLQQVDDDYMAHTDIRP